MRIAWFRERERLVGTLQGVFRNFLFSAISRRTFVNKSAVDEREWEQLFLDTADKRWDRGLIVVSFLSHLRQRL